LVIVMSCALSGANAASVRQKNTVMARRFM
jgi:hypothetical protein